MKIGKCLLSLLFGLTVSDYSVFASETQSFVEMEVSQSNGLELSIEKEISEPIISVGMTLAGPAQVTIGDKGTFDIEVDYEGIPFDGEYVFDYDDTLLEIDNQGNWEALNPGIVSVVYGYSPSEKMWQPINEHHSGDAHYDSSGAKIHEMTILDERGTNKILDSGMTLKGPTQVTVGDKGTFEIEVDFAGVPFEGEYVLSYDTNLIRIDTQGNWEAVKSGEVTITYAYKPSPAMLSELMKHFGGAIPPQPKNETVHTMKITEPKERKPSDSDKKLSKGGTATSYALIIIGAVLGLMLVLFLVKAQKKSFK